MASLHARSLLAALAVLSVSACEGGGSPTEEQPTARIAVSAVVRTEHDRYLFIRDTVRHGCATQPVITNQGTRAVTLDSIVYDHPALVVRTTVAALGLPAVLGVGGEVSPMNALFHVPAPGPSRLRVVYQDEGRRGTSETNVPCAGKVSPAETGRSGALTVELVAGSTSLYRIRNTTAAPVEWAGLQVRTNGNLSWSGLKPGTLVAAGGTAQHSVTGGTIERVGYFVGDDFGSTARQ